MSTSEFHVIDRTRWERDIYFDYYYNRIKTKYNINVNIDITRLMEWKERLHLKFFPTMLYVILRAVNQNKEFRMSFNAQGELGYWEEVVPSYTLFHPQTRTFTDIWSEYYSDFPRFYQTVCDDINRYKDVTGCIKARAGSARQFLSRFVSSLAQLYRICTRYVCRKYVAVSTHYLWQVFPSGSRHAAALLRLCEPCRSRRVSHLLPDKRHTASGQSSGRMDVRNVKSLIIKNFKHSS